MPAGWGQVVTPNFSGYTGKMSKINLVNLFGLLLFLSAFVPVRAGNVSDPPAPGQMELWQNLAAGIDYREFLLPQPEHIYVSRLERSNPQAFIETSLAQGRLGGGLETVRDQALRYDQALSYWDGEWGARYQVVAAINGGFFDPQSGLLANGMVQSGWYARQYENRQTVGGFAWRLDRQAFVTECLVSPPGKQQVVLLKSKKTAPFDGINIPREKDQLVIYTPQYGPVTPSAKSGLEFQVETGRPLMILPDQEMITGTVRAVIEDKGENFIPFDHIILSAGGKTAQALKGLLKIGDQIGIAQEIRHLDSDCRKERSEGLEQTYAGLAGSQVFLRVGEIQPLNDLGAVLRNPRTAVALNDQYVYFIVVDGRDQLRSLGMSMVELAAFAKLYLGATWGVAMDGGGSSTMVVNGEVKNNPNAETVVRARPDKIERVVANGLLMVLAQPLQQSHRFNTGDIVTVSEEGDANLRLGPGTNYTPLAVLPPGSQGVVVAHPLNGVLAKGYSWWKIVFGETAGWISESVLQEAR
jgi:hypothetical protein